MKSAWSALFLIALLLGPFGAARGAEYYGVDPGGSRYAELAQINTGNVDRLSRFRLANQRIGFLRFAACADSQGVWHGGKVFGYGER